VETAGLYLRFDRVQDAVTFTSITAFDYLKRITPDDEDASPLQTVDLTWDERLRQGSQEFRLSSSERTPFLWTTGLYLAADEITSARSVPGFTNAFDIRFGSSDKNESAALFGNAEYDLTDKLRLVGGLRYSWEQAKNLTNNAFFAT